MTQKQKELCISLLIGVFCLFVYAFQVKGYLLMETFFEAKYVSSASAMFGITDIFSPKLNGVPFFEIGPLYYLFLNLSAWIFGGFTEFSARFPSVILSFSTIIAIYFLIRNIVNKQFALIAALTCLSATAFVIFSSISSPYMFSACFSVMAVLAGITPLFIENEVHKKVYFLCFWTLLSIAVLTQGLSAIVFPLVTVLCIFTGFRRLNDFIKAEHFALGFSVFLTIMFIWIFTGYKTIGLVYLQDIVSYAKPNFLINGNFADYKTFFFNFLLYIFIGFMPWFFSLLIIFVDAPVNFLRELRENAKEDFSLNKERKLFIIFLFVFVCAIFLYLFWAINDFSRLLPAVFFGALAVAYYWYKVIYQGENSKSVQVPSMLFYLSLIIFSIIVIFAYFFVPPVQKSYLEVIITPIIMLTLLVAMPGIIAVVLNRNVLNYSMHIILSVLLFFVSTGLLYDYINSLGEDDLVQFAIKAKQNNAILVTFDLKDKYAMSYYYNNPVVFNDIIPAGDFYDKYGDSRDIYIVLKLTDLAYFDKFFVYEVVATGKHYCEITNLKYLPKDEVKDDPLADPDIY